MFLFLLQILRVVAEPTKGQQHGQCPVAACHWAAQGQGQVFLQESRPNEPLPYLNLVRQKNQPFTAPDGQRLYWLTLKPAEFICLECDEETCPGCGVVCDVKKCFGQFFEQECWCREKKDVEKETPLWTFNKKQSEFLVDNSVQRMFCDDKCGSGACAIQKFQCKTREDACKPWWWCNLPPPMAREQKHEKEVGASEKAWPTDKFRESFLQKKGLMSESRTFDKNDINNFSFKKGRWSCSSASLPPKIQDPETYLWKDRGYIVFDTSSCKGSTYEHACYCWDNASYQRGFDPNTELKRCDKECSYGNCEKKTCAPQPPPELKPEPLGDPLAIEAAGQKTLKSQEPVMDKKYPHRR